MLEALLTPSCCLSTVRLTLCVWMLCSSSLQHGGISKASKGINLSEDIFAGYNNILRGGGVEFKEYLQVMGPS